MGEQLLFLSFLITLIFFVLYFLKMYTNLTFDTKSNQISRTFLCPPVFIDLAYSPLNSVLDSTVQVRSL